MYIQMIGIDHTVASIDIRQIFSMTTTEKSAFLSNLKENPNFGGVILLSTCNRTELWVTGYEGAALLALELLCNHVGVAIADYGKLFTCRTRQTAVSYLFGLTSGLNSQIFGEDQILTQVKDALDFARSCDATDTVLEVLFRRSITGAKSAKSMMQTSTANVGAAEYCLQTLQAQGYQFHLKKCLVIGNGKLGKRAALALKQLGADVTVTVRQYRSGHVEIPVGCHRIDYGKRLELLPLCDLVVSATASPNTTLKLGHFETISVKKGLILLDLAVPRDIDPEIGTLDGITLYDIDDFHVPPSEEVDALRQQVEALLQTHVAEFFTWYDCRDALPKIGHLADCFAQDTAYRLTPAVNGLHLENSQPFQEQLQDISQKQLKKLLFSIRDEAGAHVLHSCIAALEKLYE